jgi:WS/DGAT/MGAT family acyltransferase
VGAAATLAHEGLETALHPGRVVGLGRELRDDTLAALQLLLSPIDPPSALKGGHGVAQRVAWTPALPLDEVKAIARATDTTVNDVLMSSLSGALARFLDDHGDLPRDLHAMVPFNVRPLDRPLPPELGNDFGLIMLGLALAARSPLDRLGEVSRRMRAIKDSRQPVVSYAILATIGHAPQRVEEWLIEFFSSKSTAVVTNVPGPRQPVMLAGVPISDIMAWAPCAGSISASVSIFSYCGAVTVGFMTHASHVPEPARLSDALLAEFHSLREAVSGASA